eukprot:15485048-Alexandrium_andersonii.AAC.1
MKHKTRAHVESIPAARHEGSILVVQVGDTVARGDNGHLRPPRVARRAPTGTRQPQRAVRQGKRARQSQRAQ